MTDLPAFLAAWIASQRWYANKGRLPVLESIGDWPLAAPDDAVRVVTHLLMDHAQREPVLYQVPLSYRCARVPGMESALAGITLHGDRRFVYDGPHDPAYTGSLLRLILECGQVSGGQGSAAQTRVWGRRDLGAPAVAATSGLRSRVLSGEQSNTSIIYESTEPTAASPVICKLFRVLHNGENPDVELQSVLAAVGSTDVPSPVGNLIGEWDDARCHTGETKGRARGHLACAQEYLPGAEDAWRIALRAAASGEDFTTAAHALGAATARVHASLATALPTIQSTAADIAAVLDQLRGRLETAINAVPALAEYRAAVQAVFELARSVPWPARQRIHGDLHLGQALAVPGRGWVLVDFEGEPLRPMLERSQLDLPLRDVAGMLRSFDYVAGSLALGLPPVQAQHWASAARHAFVDGYVEASGYDIRANRVLLDAFEIDKALYETVYEARNRPGWLTIPVSAVERLARRATHFR